MLRLVSNPPQFSLRVSYTLPLPFGCKFNLCMHLQRTFWGHSLLYKKPLIAHTGVLLLSKLTMRAGVSRR